MTKLAYPQTLSIDCFREVTEIVRNRQIAERAADFASCVWNVQGYLQGLILGPGHEHQMFGAAAAQRAQQTRDAAVNDERLRDFAMQMEDVNRELQSNEMSVSMAAAAPQSGSTLVLIMQLVPVILQLLKQLNVIKREGDAPQFGQVHGAGQGSGDEEARRMNEEQQSETVRSSNEASHPGPAVTGPQAGKEGTTTGEGTSNDVQTASGQNATEEEAKAKRSTRR